MTEEAGGPPPEVLLSSIDGHLIISVNAPVQDPKRTTPLAKERTMDETWKVWGDGTEPIFVGSEDEVKAKVVSEFPNDSTVYIESPGGHELEYDEGSWHAVF